MNASHELRRDRSEEELTSLCDHCSLRSTAESEKQLQHGTMLGLGIKLCQSYDCQFKLKEQFAAFKLPVPIVCARADGSPTRSGLEYKILLTGSLSSDRSKLLVICQGRMQVTWGSAGAVDSLIQGLFVHGPQQVLLL
jgi:hypothetical protein